MKVAFVVMMVTMVVQTKNCSGDARKAAKLMILVVMKAEVAMLALVITVLMMALEMMVVVRMVVMVMVMTVKVVISPMEVCWQQR